MDEILIDQLKIIMQSKDLGSNPSAVESVFFSTERFSNSLNIWIYIYLILKKKQLRGYTSVRA